MNIKQWVSSLPENKGGTFSFNSELPSTGYFVSLIGKELVLDEPPSLDVIKHYIDSNPAALYNYLGCWYNDGKWYLDTSVHKSGREDAILFAKDNGQKAIWDIENGDSIFL